MESIRKNYPIHYLVWNNDSKELDELIQTGKVRFFLR